MVRLELGNYIGWAYDAYGPPQGAVIATVNFTGSGGAQYSKKLIAGTDIRDFCQNFFANTINNTTTRNAFAVNHVRDSCGTGNVNTGWLPTIASTRSASSCRPPSQPRRCRR